jgi:hypothetical protein
MKNKNFIKLLLLAVILSFVTLSCNSGGSSDVTIVINLGSENNASFNAPGSSSIIDRVLCLFATKAEAAPPSYITSLTLNITGDGMDTITKIYTSPSIPDTITLKIPAGESRTFELLAYSSSVTLRGVATRNLSGGATVIVPIQMELFETKIIVSDYNNNRIVQFDKTYSSSSWISKTAFSGFTGNFRPFDIDYDNKGRIYISNEGFAANDGRIIRVNQITTGTDSCNLIGTQGSTTTKRGIAIDRVNNYLYYTDSSLARLYRYNINTESEDGYLTLPRAYVFGIDIDNEGYAYIVCNYTYYATGTYNYILKYNINTQNTETYITTDSGDTAHYTSWLNDPWDIIVKSDYIYITDRTNLRVTQLNKYLIYQQSLNSSPDKTSSFFGPHRFAAILNKKIYVTDDNSSDTARMFAFDDISGSNWEIYGQHGFPANGAGYFLFYCIC